MIDINEKFSQKHVILFSILLALAFVVIFGFGAVTIGLIFILPPEILSLPAMDYVLSSINNLFAFVILIVIAKKLGLFEDIPWNVRGISKGLLLGIPVLLFCLVQLSGILEATYDCSIAVNVFGVVAALIYCAAIALWEEFLCRGVILTNMLKKWGNSKGGIVKAVILSAFIFGCAHIITGFGGLDQYSYSNSLCIIYGIIIWSYLYQNRKFGFHYCSSFYIEFNCLYNALCDAKFPGYESGNIYIVNIWICLSLGY